MLRRLAQTTTAAMLAALSYASRADDRDEAYNEPSDPTYFRVNTTTYRLFLDLYDKALSTLRDTYINSTICDATKTIVTEAPTHYDRLARWINPFNAYDVDGELERGAGQPQLTEFENCSISYLDAEITQSRGDLAPVAQTLTYGLFFGLISLFAVGACAASYLNNQQRTKRREQALARGETPDPTVPRSLIESCCGPTAHQAYEALQNAEMQQPDNTRFGI